MIHLPERGSWYKGDHLLFTDFFSTAIDTAIYGFPLAARAGGWG